MAMAFEWAALGVVTAAEAIILLLLTLPGIQGLRKSLIIVGRTSLRPLLGVVPFCLFLLLDIYLKVEYRPKCRAPSCSVAEQIPNEKFVFKSQRDTVLVLGALLLSWLLYGVTAMLARMEHLSTQTKKLKPSE